MTKVRLLKSVTLTIVMIMIVAACGHKALSATVSVTSDPPLVVRSENPVYEKSDTSVWFRHDMAVENSSDHAIVIDSDPSSGGEYLGNYMLLVTSGCGPGTPEPGQTRPSIICTTEGHLPFTITPYASVKLSAITVSKGLAGMTPLKPGKYVWKKDVSWHYSDNASEIQTSHVAITYTIH